MEVTCYTADMREAWDRLVRTSRNGTFLFERQFMDYHADRFEDCSLLFARKGKVLGVLPCSKHGETVVSHGGLTYGGFILSPSAHANDVGEMLDGALDFYRSAGFKSLMLKPVPSIYHTQRADDELYWLYRKGATISARGLSSAVDLKNPLPFSTLRKRKLNKAREVQLIVEADIPLEAKDVWARYWDILTQVLADQHSKKPVHSLDEMLLLKSRFPQQIQLWGVMDHDKNLVAGTILFFTQTVIHAQYIASSPEGKGCGALDLLFHKIIEDFRDDSPCKTTASPAAYLRYLDFGISTEQGGDYLNDGLIFQKEGFGARSVVYDAYTIDF